MWGVLLKLRGWSHAPSVASFPYHCCLIPISLLSHSFTASGISSMQIVLNFRESNFFFANSDF